MQNLQQMYQSKRGSALDALDHLLDGDMIIVPTGVGEPPTLLQALSEQYQRFSDIKVAQILAMRKYGYFEQACRPHVRHAAPRGLAARAAGATSSPTIFPKSRR
jgi:acyl-CoA hydrolase